MPEKILIVDDAVFHRMKCKKALSEGGYETDEAADGQEALDKVQSTPPDLVLLDITMPGMDGIAVLKSIMEKSPAVRVVMFTAQGQHSLIAQALLLGARDYITKPASDEKLLATVRRVLKGGRT